MNPILDKILAAKREEVSQLKKQVPLNALRERPLYGAPRRSFREALEQAGPPAVIAELKKASPSKGLLRPDFDVAHLCRAYTDNRAAALSVLTEKNFFLGGLENIEAARACSPLPLLRKDFIFDPYQLHEARAAGADALLLIAVMLEKSLLEDLAAQTRELNLQTLVEVHDEADLEKAAPCGADVFGVNNRNLKTFDVALENSLRLAPLFPKQTCKISESGIKDHADIQRLLDAGYTGFLIGESLVTAQDPGAALRRLISPKGVS